MNSPAILPPVDVCNHLSCPAIVWEKKRARAPFQQSQSKPEQTDPERHRREQMQGASHPSPSQTPSKSTQGWTKEPSVGTKGPRKRRSGLCCIWDKAANVSAPCCCVGLNRPNQASQRPKTVRRVPTKYAAGTDFFDFRIALSHCCAYDRISQRERQASCQWTSCEIGSSAAPGRRPLCPLCQELDNTTA